MYGDQSGEFVCGHGHFKGAIIIKRFENQG